MNRSELHEVSLGTGRAKVRRLGCAIEVEGEELDKEAIEHYQKGGVLVVIEDGKVTHTYVKED